MTNPVALQIKFGQAVSWWDSPWRCSKVEQQDKVLSKQIVLSVQDAAIDCMADLDILHWDNVASIVRSFTFPPHHMTWVPRD